jgi:hypothetical protein
MNDIRMTLSIIWIAVMLIYLLGDVIRIFACDVVLGEIDGTKFTQAMGLGIAGLMVTPILMVMLTLVLPHNICRWTNIILATLWFIFNLIGLPGYKGHYDKFLLAVSMIFNLIIIWFAWNWI